MNYLSILNYVPQDLHRALSIRPLFQNFQNRDKCNQNFLGKFPENLEIVEFAKKVYYLTK